MTDTRVEVTRAHFDAQAAEYDAQRPYRLHYAEMHDWSEEVIAEQRQRQEENRRRLAGVDHGASTLDEFLGYLRGAGLVNVDCLWKHGPDVVVYAEQAA